MTAPAAPVLSARNNGNLTASLFWEAVEGATLYTVYRDAVLVDTTTALAFVDDGLTEDADYTYTVTATNGDGEGDPSNEEDIWAFVTEATGGGGSGGTSTLAEVLAAGNDPGSPGEIAAAADGVADGGFLNVTPGVDGAYGGGVSMASGGYNGTLGAAVTLSGAGLDGESVIPGSIAISTAGESSPADKALVGGTGAFAGSLVFAAVPAKVASVALTNAQIKALGAGTPVTIVAAPGAGKVIVLQRAMVWVNASVPYTTSGVSSSIVFAIGSTSVSNPMTGEDGTLYTLFGGEAGGSAFATCVGRAWATSGYAFFATDVENGALVLTGTNNSEGAFTDGNAANSGLVKVWYTIEDVL